MTSFKSVLKPGTISHQSLRNWENGTTLRMRCEERFTHAFTACNCVFKEIALVGSNQGNYFENATVWTKRTLKTTVATQLKATIIF